MVQTMFVTTFTLQRPADIVADPSAPNAFVEGIMEGKEWVWNNGALLEAELVEMNKEFDAKQARLDESRNFLLLQSFLKDFNFINKY